MSKEFMDDLGDVLAKHKFMSPGKYVMMYEVGRNEDGTVSFEELSLGKLDEKKEARDFHHFVLGTVIFALVCFLLGMALS